MNLRVASLFILCILTISMASACSSPSNPYTNHGLRDLLNAQTTLPKDTWTDLLSKPLQEDLCDAKTIEATSDPSNLLATTESCYAQGLHTASFQASTRLLEQHPNSTLAPWAFARVFELSRHVPKANTSLKRILPALQNASKPHILTRIYTARLAADLAYDTWKHTPPTNTANDAPFNGAPWGVPTRWRVVGPVSLYPNLELGQTTPPEDDTSLKDTYTLLGFNRRTETIFSTPSGTSLPSGTEGIYVAETHINLNKATRLDVAALFSHGAVLSIDGTPVLSYDPRDRFTSPSLVARGVELSSGAHRITVRYAHKSYANSRIELTLLPEDPTALQGPPRKHRGSLENPGFQTPWIQPSLNLTSLTSNPGKLYLTAALATRLGHDSVAQNALSSLNATFGSSPLVHILRSSALLQRPDLPSSVRKRDAIRALRKAAQSDPNALFAHHRLASLLRGESLLDTAQKHISTFTQKRPNELVGWTELARLYDARSLNTKHEDALLRALAIDPTHCAVATQVQNAWIRRNYTPKPDAQPPAWSSCDYVRWRAQEQHHAHTTSTQHKTDYLNLLKRETARYPNHAWTWRHLARTQLELSSPQDALQTLDQALTHHPENLDLLLQKAELLLTTQQRQQALETLQVAQTYHPSSRSSQRLTALLNSALPIQDLYVNGLKAIQDFERNPQRLRSSAIYILDYMARRYFDDGSSTDITHIVVKVLDKDGLNEQGEVQFPRGTVPLMIRTIKRNGSIVEPSPDQSKPTISMPSLDVGDYIEYAYLTYNGRSPIQQGAFIGASFYFQMSNIASARSEFVVEYPSSWTPEIIRRNNPPQPEVTKTDDRTRLRFLHTSSNQPRPEPRSVSNAEFLPHVQLLHNISWDDSRRFLQNDAAGAHALSDDLISKARTLTKDAKTDTERTRALFDFAKTHLRSRSFNDLSTPAAHALQSNSGNPITLLKALLKAVDISSEIVRIKRHTQDPVETAIPATGLYDFTALKVLADQGELWLYPDGPNAPFDYLPVFAQNSSAFSIENNTEFKRFRTPSWEPELETRDVRMDLSFDDKGNLTGTVTETLQGFNAMKRRDRFNELASDENQRKFIERILNYDFNGAELTNYTLGALDNPDEPLTLTYTFKRPGYARLNPDGSVVTEDRYDLIDITRTYARLPARTVPMLLQYHTSIRTHITVRGPSGFSISGPGGPDTLSINSTFGEYQRTVQRSPSTLVMEHALTLPIQRIQPNQYTKFRAWAGDLDRATYGRIELRP